MYGFSVVGGVVVFFDFISKCFLYYFVMMVWDVDFEVEFVGEGDFK